MESEIKFGEWLASLGWTLNMLGFVLFYQYLTGDLQSEIYMWPLVFPQEQDWDSFVMEQLKAKSSPLKVENPLSR
jgi:hypothetical protein